MLEISYGGKLCKTTKMGVKSIDLVKVGKEFTVVASHNLIYVFETEQMSAEPLYAPICLDAIIEQAELSPSQEQLAVYTSLQSLLTINLRNGQLSVLKQREHSEPITHFDY